MRTTIIAVLLAALAGCGKKPDPVLPPSGSVVVSPVDDLKKAQGRWVLDDAQAVGEAPPSKEMLAAITFAIEGETGRVVRLGGPEKVFAIKIDPTKAPAEVDFTEADEKGAPKATTRSSALGAEAKVETRKAIYKFDGDRLVVALPTDERLPRPTEFAPKAWPADLPGQSGPGTVVLILKRQAADAKPADPTVVEKIASKTNLRQVGLGIHNFDSAQGGLPSQAVFGAADKPLLSWRVNILPYIDEEALFKQFKLDEPWDGPTNKPLIAKMPKVYAKPGTNPAKGETFLKVFHGFQATFNNNVFQGGNRVSRSSWSIAALTSSPRGTSNIVLCVEAGDPVTWTKPDDYEYDPKKPLPNLKGAYADGFHALKADGTVLFVKAGFRESAMRASIDPNSPLQEHLETDRDPETRKTP